jgi:hypothetical protein
LTKDVKVHNGSKGQNEGKKKKYEQKRIPVGTRFSAPYTPAVGYTGLL